MRSKIRPALVVMIIAATPTLALAQRDSAVQFTKDGASTLVQKDFGTERWSITHRVQDGFTTGNVFFTDGSASAFLSCERTAFSEGQMTFNCFSAVACVQEPCPEYDLIGEVSLGADFFFPKPSDQPQPPPSTLDALLGRWRFTITTSQTTAEFTYRFTRIEAFPEGDVIVGESTTGNRLVGAMQDDGDIVIWDEFFAGCNTYLFKFTGPDRVEGLEFLTRWSSDEDLCTGIRINDVTNTFVGERIG